MVKKGGKAAGKYLFNYFKSDPEKKESLGSATEEDPAAAKQAKKAEIKEMQKAAEKEVANQKAIEKSYTKPKDASKAIVSLKGENEKLR